MIGIGTALTQNHTLASGCTMLSSKLQMIYKLVLQIMVSQCTYVYQLCYCNGASDITLASFLSLPHQCTLHKPCLLTLHDTLGVGRLGNEV